MSFFYLIYTGGCLSFSGTAFPFSDSECLQHTCKEKYCLSRCIAILNKRSPKVEITSNNVKFSGLKQYQCIISPISVSLLSPARQSLWPTWHWQGCSCLRSQLELQVVWDFPSGLIHTPSCLHSHLPTVSAHFLRVWKWGLRRVKVKATGALRAKPKADVVSDQSPRGSRSRGGILTHKSGSSCWKLHLRTIAHTPVHSRHFSRIPLLGPEGLSPRVRVGSKVSVCVCMKTYLNLVHKEVRTRSVPTALCYHFIKCIFRWMLLTKHRKHQLQKAFPDIFEGGPNFTLKKFPVPNQWFSFYKETLRQEEAGDVYGLRTLCLLYPLPGSSKHQRCSQSELNFSLSCFPHIWK